MYRYNLKNQKECQGFTLIELMVAVAIVGVLASMASAAFGGFKIKAARSEATVNLRTIHTLMETAFADLGGYPSSVLDLYGPIDADISKCSTNSIFKDIGFSASNCPALRYLYGMNVTSLTSYVAVAYSVKTTVFTLGSGVPVSTGNCDANGDGLTGDYVDAIKLTHSASASGGTIISFGTSGSSTPFLGFVDTQIVTSILDASKSCD